MALFVHDIFFPISKPRMCVFARWPGLFATSFFVPIFLLKFHHILDNCQNANFKVAVDNITLSVQTRLEQNEFGSQI